MNQGATFAGRHVMVTGASRGIGAAVARGFASRGASVTLVARDMDRLRQVADALAVRGDARHVALEADLTRGLEAERVAAQAQAALGGVFALINNVGGAESAAFVETGDDTWQRMLDVNLMTAVFCSRALLPGMQERREGRIVNVASLAGLMGFRYVSAYTAAKHALVGLTRALALETARDGVTVNAVCPGYTDTEMLTESARRAAARTGKSVDDIRSAYASANPAGRLITPDEVAHSVVWLCEPAQGAVTGEAIPVDGQQGSNAE
jgi:NAD(P)-dependent dehydrogenase (short-subunit alcohol dehydrogenase family)